MTTLPAHSPGKGTGEWGSGAQIVIGAVIISAGAGCAITVGNLYIVLPFAIIGALSFLPVLTSARKWAIPFWLAVGPALFPFARFPSGQGSTIITFDRVWILGLALVSMPELLSLASAGRSTRRFLGWAAFLSAIILLRSIVALSGGVSGLSVWLDAFLIPIVAFLLVRMTAINRETIDRYLLCLGIGGAVAGSIAIAQRLLGFSLAELSGGVVRIDHDSGITRFAGPFDVPEVLVCMLIVTVAATICWRMRKGPTATRLAVVLISVQCSGIFLAYFRTGLAAAAVILIGAIAFRRGSGQRALAVLVVSVAVVSVGVSQLAQTDSTFASRLDNTNNYYSRLAAYQQGFTIFKSSPLIGVGIGKYNVNAKELTPVFVNGRRAVVHAHNSFIQLATEAGVMALIGAVGLFVAALMLCRSLWRRSQNELDDSVALCTGLAIVGYLMMSTTLSMMEYGVPSGALFTMLALVSARIDQISPGRS